MTVDIFAQKIDNRQRYCSNVLFVQTAFNEGWKFSGKQINHQSPLDQRFWQQLQYIPSQRKGRLIKHVKKIQLKKPKLFWPR